MSRAGYFWRLAASVAIDLADFTIGRAMFAIPWEEAFGAVILVPLWGWAGLLYVAEVADLTEQIDAFIPMATAIGLLVGWRNGHLFGTAKKPPALEEKAPS